MKIPVQYLNDSNGNVNAVLPLNEWEKVLKKIQKYEQALKLKSDLVEAFEQVSFLKNKSQKQTLSDFLGEI